MEKTKKCGLDKGYDVCDETNCTHIKDHARAQAEAQLVSIHGLVDALSRGEPYKEYTDEESIKEAIQQDALEFSIRSTWANSSDMWEADQYRITLASGGPSVRIIGNLDGVGQPETAQLEYQDWGTPWTRLPLTQEDIDALLTYAGCFYFGD